MKLFAVLCTLLMLTLAANAGGDGEVKIHLTIPKAVAAQAASRAKGDAKSATPVVLLKGVEIGDDEGITIELYGTPAGGSGKPVFLGMASTVGESQKVVKRPIRKADLVIALNDKGLVFVQGREVTFTLRVSGSPGREPLKFERALFAGE
jgi:hypothetical protein